MISPIRIGSAPLTDRLRVANSRYHNELNDHDSVSFIASMKLKRDSVRCFTAAEG